MKPQGTREAKENGRATKGATTKGVEASTRVKADSIKVRKSHGDNNKLGERHNRVGERCSPKKERAKDTKVRTELTKPVSRRGLPQGDSGAHHYQP